MVRKHLGYDLDEWLSFPWWKQQMYFDELQDFLRRESEDSDGAEEAPGRRAGRGDGEQVGGVTESSADFAQFGIPVRRVAADAPAA